LLDSRCISFVVLLAALDAVDVAEELTVLDVAKDAVYVVADVATGELNDELLADEAGAA